MPTCIFAEDGLDSICHQKRIVTEVMSSAALGIIW
jgi:hypothetical protein